MINKLVWSVNTIPFSTDINRHNNKYEDFLYLFAYSYLLNKRWFGKTELVTDNLGKKILVDMVGLEFDSINLCLNNMEAKHKDLFAFGKIMAYEEQKEPFIHVDFDLFFHKKPPISIYESDISVQNKETGQLFKGYAHIFHYIDSCKIDLPLYFDTWINYAYNCGFVAVNDLSFIKRYCEIARELSDTFPDKITRQDIFVEQVGLSFTEKELNISVNTLIKESIQSFDCILLPSLNEYGLQHLLGDFKKSPVMMMKIKKEVAEISTELNEKIIETLNKLI